MGEKRQRVWELFMELTGLDQMELQRELNPIIHKLNVDLNNIQMDEIRQIVTVYMENLIAKRLKSVGYDEEEPVAPSYTN